MADRLELQIPSPEWDRTVIIGNGGGGKSTLARLLSARHDLPYIEIDKLLWRPGWKLAPEEDYNPAHHEIINRERWLIDGLGQKDSLLPRLERATAIILVDMPLWMHFWLAAERQMAWDKGDLRDTPGGIEEMPPTEALFRTMSEIDRDWMPLLRDLTGRREEMGIRVERIMSVDQLTEVQRALTGP